MDTRNLANAVSALAALGYRPRAPVPFEQFVDPDCRRQWIDEKRLTVFSLFSPDHPVTEIDLFIDPPLIFADAYSRAVRLEVAPETVATFCSLDDLIDLKTKGRHRPAPQNQRQPLMNASNQSDPLSVHSWEHGWDEHERMQLKRLARLPLADKLAWLEKAHRAVLRSGALPAPCTDDPASPKPRRISV
jgi:hypothetical protein